MILQSPSTSSSVCDSDPGSCRLLYVVGQLGIGGLERQLYYLLATLDQRSYRPAVVVWNLNPDEKYYREIAALKVPIYGLPVDCSPVKKLRIFRDMVSKTAPEIIHSYGFHTNFAAYYAARGTKAVPVGSLRSDFATVKKVGGVIRGALNARWPAWHISNSTACAAAASQNHSFFTPRYFAVVRNGLDLQHFTDCQASSRGRTYIASVGSLLPVKRWDRLLRAVQKVRALFTHDIQFRIAGDGPLRSELERMAEKLGISETVQFVGAVQDVPAFLRGARFLVHTSESEGCPNVVMEAMACGLPVVAMDAGDILCLIDNGRTGFVIGQDDQQALVDRICLLRNDELLCRRMGEAGREKAQQDFSLHRFVSETLEAYKHAGWRDQLV